MKLTEALKNAVYPPHCLACGKILSERTVFCGTCLAEIPFVTGKRCEKCGIEMHPDFPSPICGRCRNLKPHFDRNFPAMEHVGAGRTSALNLKYGSSGAISDAAMVISQMIIRERVIPEVVTYVPNFGKGSSVTERLAFYTAKYLGVKCETLLKKTRATEKQKTLTFARRMINVRGAYEAVKVPDAKSVLIVDDVFTTGATMNECAKVLKKKFKGKIYTATFTIRDRE